MNLIEGAPVDGQTIGVDEAGRGCMAGPLVVAAVCWPIGYTLAGLNDSKKITNPDTREKLYEEIVTHLKYSSWHLDACEIDSYGLTESAARCGAHAIQGVLGQRPAYDNIILDGTPGNWGDIEERLDFGVDYLVRGDQQVEAIMAASIVAKVTRDHMMEMYHSLYPEYGFAIHKGYVTEMHMAKLYELGPLDIHRFSYAPVMRAVHDRATKGTRKPADRRTRS